jgi:O-methyltransferase
MLDAPRDGAPDAARVPDVAAFDAYSMCGVPILTNLARIARDAARRGVRGDIVECGVCNGGSAGVLYASFREASPAVWLYDSFEGLPAPTPVDGPAAGAYAGHCVGSEEMVRRAMGVAGVEPARLHVKRGWFDATFREPLPETIAILHVDADWYDSVSLCLRTFYDHVVDGGVIILDDFGQWEGCREAFYDFARARGIKPLLERFEHTQAYWIKGRAHNRIEPFERSSA